MRSLILLIVLGAGAPVNAQVTGGERPSTISVPSIAASNGYFGTPPTVSTFTTAGSLTLDSNATVAIGTLTFVTPSLFNAGNSGTSLTINWSQGNTQYVTLTGNCVFTFNTPHPGQRYILILKQDGTGSRLATWPATVRWPSGTAVSLTTTASKVDYVQFIYNSVDGKYDGVSAAYNF